MFSTTKEVRVRKPERPFYPDFYCPERNSPHIVLFRKLDSMIHSSCREHTHTHTHTHTRKRQKAGNPDSRVHSPRAPSASNAFSHQAPGPNQGDTHRG